jgi:hypothetical protein
LWLVVTFFLHPTPWLDMMQRVLGDLSFLPT